MLNEWLYVEALPGWLVFHHEDGTARRVAVRPLACGCMSDGSALCREHDRGPPPAGEMGRAA
jgi:hypothetical protein